MDVLTRDLIAARNGNQRALGRFVRASQGEVWRLCAHLSGRDEADDLTQQVYMRALRSLPAYRGDASARTWLLTIARHTCSDAVRAHVRRRRALAAVPSPPPAHDPSAQVDLESLLGALDDGQREAFVYTQVVGLRYEEAAGVCGVPVGTIRSRVARARHALVAALAEAQAVLPQSASAKFRRAGELSRRARRLIPRPEPD